MTTQKKRFIELNDILALTFQCSDPECAAIFSVSLFQKIRMNKLVACPHCGRLWLRLGEGGNIESSFSDCVERIKVLRENLESGFFNGFSLKLEIKDEDAIDENESAELKKV